MPETAEANSIRFEIPPELARGLRVQGGPASDAEGEIGGEEVRRNYSLCTAPAEQDWMVTVKRIAGGVFSNWVGDNLKAGDTVEVMPPHGSFTTEFDADAPSATIVGFAGGSGITPVHVADADRAEAKSRRASFTLLYGNRDSSSIIFLEELAELKDRYSAASSSTFPRRGRGRRRPVQRHARPRDVRRGDRAAGRRSGRASTPGSSAAPGR